MPRFRMLFILCAVLVAGATGASATSPGAFDRGSDVVNHRVGDASFIARFGRLPDAGDSEALRMDTHLRFIRDRLAAGPATSPALLDRRRELLGYLDDYIALGKTPKNAHLPFRSPVFIDDAGAICAVGYLVMRSAGRQLAEDVAAMARYQRLEDMAVPALSAWVADSGFTVDELASIQPAYGPPPLDAAWTTWVGPRPRARRPADGPWRMVAVDGTVTTGAWRGGRMDGAWRRTTAKGAVIGEGTMVRGAGAWTGRYPDGTLAAQGRYRRDAPQGAWRLYYPSGRVAAEGAFKDGLRWGRWRFFHDAAGAPLLAEGRYRGYEVGAWQHHDRDGRRLATVHPVRGAGTAGFTVTWYGEAGQTEAIAAIAEVDAPPAFVITHHANGRLRALRTYDATLHYHDNGRLMAVRPAQDRAAATLSARARRVLTRLGRAGRLPRDGASVPRAFLRALEALDQVALAPVAFDRAGRVVTAPEALATLAAAEASGSAALDLPLTRRSLAGELVPPCDEDEVPQHFCIPSYQKAGGGLRALISTTDPMVVAGLNYRHLDAILHRANRTMPDRTPSRDFGDRTALPTPFAAPPAELVLEDEYGWTTWGPVLKRHHVRLADVF